MMIRLNYSIFCVLRSAFTVEKLNMITDTYLSLKNETGRLQFFNSFMMDKAHVSINFWCCLYSSIFYK